MAYVNPSINKESELYRREERLFEVRYIEDRKGCMGYLGMDINSVRQMYWKSN